MRAQRRWLRTGLLLGVESSGEAEEAHGADISTQVKRDTAWFAPQILKEPRVGALVLENPEH